MIWKRVGTQGDEWKHGQVEIPRSTKNKPLSIAFEGIRGNGYAGDIALDDISIAQRTCPASRKFMIFVLCLFHLYHIIFFLPEKTIFTNIIKHESLFVTGECTFESISFSDGSRNNLCGWVNAKNDQFDWTIATGSTPSVKTGPRNDHTYNSSAGIIYSFILNLY